MNKKLVINTILRALIFVAVSGAIFSGALLLKGEYDSRRQQQLQEELSQVVMAEPAAKPTPEPVSQPEPSYEPEQVAESAPPEAPQEEPQEPQMLDWCVNLKERYPDLVGWITIGEDIYLPVVQTDDNEYYLDHAIDGSENRLGAVFMDYEKDPVTLYGNTYLYGHHYLNDHENMFAPLEKYHQKDYAFDNPSFTYSSLYHVYECRIFSSYTIYPDDWRIYAVKFDGVEDYQAWIDERLELSDFDYGVEAGKNNRIISLSTCDYTFKDARQIIHAVMIEIK